MRLEDMKNKAVQDQARRLLLKQAIRSRPLSPASLRIAQPAPVKPKQPSKTELAYRDEILALDESVETIRYEALSFKMANGHRYTPDWITTDLAGNITCHEVKGSYRLGSYQRARLAFDQTRIEWPAITWIWAERQKDGTWGMS